MKSAKIIGMGHYVPDNVVTNQQLEPLMDTNDAWIQERTGIKERRHIVPGGEDTTSTMATKASQMAIEKAGIQVDDIDFIVFATLSPDYYFPGPGVMLQQQLGFKKEIGALDIRNQCSGFVYGLSVADQFIKTGMYKTVLVVGSEVHSGGLDFTTRGRGVSVIFGDGAGAAILQVTEEKGKGILSTHLHSEGQHAEELALIGPATTDWVPNYIERNDAEDIRYYPYMNGNFVFKHAVVRFQQVIQEALEQNGYQADDIDMLIPHQANLRISQFIQKQMNLTDERVFNNIQKYGNTTAASIPLALSEALEEGKVKAGDLVCLAAFGSGFTWASALIRW
ncbi:3-oxoacyl-ACP synthase III family protein [Reichenbachiella faecimaris]|nr:beta-ketoacyl-ACP synthase III [Reichenbachiella faecimaris]